jgi:hypothetical protein
MTQMVDLAPILPTLSICRHPGFKTQLANSKVMDLICDDIKKNITETDCLQMINDNMFKVEDFIGLFELSGMLQSANRFAVPLSTFRPIIPDNDLVGRYAC